MNKRQARNPKIEAALAAPSEGKRVKKKVRKRKK